MEFRGDIVDEPIETLTLSIGNVPASFVAAAPAEAVLTLVDDDHPFDAASFGAAEAAASEGGALEEVVTLEREVVLEIEDRADSAGASLDDFDGVSDGVGFRDGWAYSHFARLVPVDMTRSVRMTVLESGEKGIEEVRKVTYSG